MNKQYIENKQCLNQGVKNAIIKLDDKYPNAISVFGSALWAYQPINPDLKSFIAYLPSVIHNAKFYSWHEGAVGALRRFCRLCLVDPMLVELYIGMSFDELVTKS